MKSSPRQVTSTSVHDGASLSGSVKSEGVPTECSSTSGRSGASQHSGRSACHRSGSSRIGEAKMRRDLLKLNAAHLENEQKLLREKNIIKDRLMMLRTRNELEQASLECTMLENSDYGSVVNKQDSQAPDTRTDNLSNVDVNVIKGVLSQVESQVVDVRNGITSGVHGRVTDVQSGVTGDVHNGVTGVQSGITSGVHGIVSDVQSCVTGGVYNGVTGVHSSMTSGVHNGVTGVQSGVLSIEMGIPHMQNDMSDKLDSAQVYHQVYCGTPGGVNGHQGSSVPVGNQVYGGTPGGVNSHQGSSVPVGHQVYGDAPGGVNSHQGSGVSVGHQVASIVIKVLVCHSATG